MKTNKEYQRPESSIIFLEVEEVIAGSTGLKSEMGSRTPNIGTRESFFLGQGGVLNGDDE